MILIHYILLFTVLSSGIFFLINKIKINQHLAPFLVLFFNTFVLYIFSLFNILRIGFYLTCLISLGLGIYALIDWVKNKKERQQILTTGVVLWVIIFFSLILYNYGALLSRWDEFSYWGPFYKYLMLFNNLPKDISNLSNITYPPFTGLTQYYFGQFLGSKESSAYFGHMLMEFSLLLALFPEKKMGKRKFLLILVVSFLLAFFFDFQYQSLYVDLMLGLLFGLGLISASQSNNFTYQNMSIFVASCLAMVLTKPTGFIFVVVCWLFLIYSLQLGLSNEKPLRERINFFFRAVVKPQILLCILLPILAYFSWSLHSSKFKTVALNVTFSDPNVNSRDIFPIYESDYIDNLKKLTNQIKTKTLLLQEPQEVNISVIGLIRNFTVNAPYRVKVIISSFNNNFFVFNGGWSGFSLFEDLLFLSLLIFVGFIFSEKKSIKEFSLINFFIIGLLGLVIYSLFLLSAYIYFFPQSEALIAHSSSRYQGTYILGLCLFVIYSIMNEKYKKIPSIKMDFSLVIGFSLIAVILLSIPAYSYFHLPLSPVAYRFTANNLYKSTVNLFTENDKVYLIYDGDKTNGQIFYISKYLFEPISTNNFGWELTTDDKSKNYQAAFLSPTDWLNLLNDQKYTYVYVVTSGASFWQSYGNLFDYYSNKQTIDGFISPQLFKVTPTGLINVPITVKFYE